MAIGLLSLVTIILLHGVGLRIVTSRFNRAWVRITPGTAQWRINLLLATAVGWITLVHLIETLVYAVPLYAGGIFPELRDSYYYVLESYTTLGEGRLTLPEHWRLLGPIIAMSGLFTFGWTGSVLVSIMSQVAALDSARASRARKRRRGRGSDRGA